MTEQDKKPEITQEDDRRAFLARAAKVSLAIPAGAVLLRSKMAKATPSGNG